MVGAAWSASSAAAAPPQHLIPHGRPPQRPRSLQEYTKAISTLGRQQEWSAAAEQLGALSREGLEPNVISYGALLSACDKANAWRIAVGLLQTSSCDAVELSTVALNSLLSACGGSKQWSKAQNCVVEQLQEGLASSVTTLGAAVSSCQRSSTWRCAVQLLFWPGLAGVEVNVVAGNAAMSALSRAREWHCGQQLLDNLRELLVAPTVVSYNSVAGAGADADVVEERTKALSSWKLQGLLLKDMRRQALLPSVISCSQAVSSCGSTSKWMTSTSLLHVG
eukprot:TRINITY_DN113300_c0_g1_i1.p1 TRINITY_DN113300_c0_g1~~TRINITY_DN113300_c0_g1_i1.p1  ORF type:complete len:279 (+),score=75.22 TRINITY_DN113300_c0_g1_i1:122-958(+)